MTRINFQEVSSSRTVKTQCRQCGRKLRRVVSETQTVNPFREDKATTPAEVMAAVRATLAAKVENYKPPLCRACEAQSTNTVPIPRHRRRSRWRVSGDGGDRREVMLVITSPAIFRLWVFAARTWDAFILRESYRDLREANVCTVIRTLFLWLPTVVVSNAAFVAAFLYIIFIHPTDLWGLTYLRILGFLALVAIWVALGRVVWLSRPTAPPREWPTSQNAVVALVNQRLHDAHDRICSPVTFGAPHA